MPMLFLSHDSEPSENCLRQRRQLEQKTQELAHSLAMMHATLESTTDGILVTDGSGQVTAFNQRYVDMWGLPPETMEYERPSTIA